MGLQGREPTALRLLEPDDHIELVFDASTGVRLPEFIKLIFSYVPCNVPERPASRQIVPAVLETG